MNTEQGILFLLILLLFSLLLWGRIRYDLAALSVLVIASILGVIPIEKIFSGFGHPAVIIIALVLIISRGLSRSGAIDLLARRVVNPSRNVNTHVGVMASISASLSSIMNNVAALALLMPVDLQAAKRAKRSPAITLMPLSFASILGGMVTLIGTPPNIVISTFREDVLGKPFNMFDFAPVGAAVAIVGVVYIIFIGWRLIPVERRKQNTAYELEDLKGYVTEAEVADSSAAIGKALKDIEPLAAEYDVHILGLIHQGKRLPGFSRNHVINKNDLLVIEGSPDAIDQFVGAVDLKFSDSSRREDIISETDMLMEVVVPEGARIEGRSAHDIRLLYRKGVTLLGISRKGKRIRKRIRNERIKAGDLMLLLGSQERLPDVAEWLGCLPLAQRGLEITQRNKAWLTVGIFAAAIVAASLDLIYLPLALAAVAITYVAIRVVPLSQIYESIEWPVIVLLGSMIPISVALETSGGTALLANTFISWTKGLPTTVILAILMIVTMTLSDILNNVATVLIAAPIGMDIAGQLNANPDSFLMAVAVASSCAFLTPIGHKNNTIIMGPGGYKFGDYWRMGLPLEILVVLVAIPMILIVWPL